MKYVIGNWKANKSLEEVKSWLNVFLDKDFSGLSGRVEIIICPPFTFLSLIHEKIEKFPFIKVASQTISHFDSGPHTGEVTSANLKGLVNYSLIGHSERREYFGETDEQLRKKVDLALKQAITPLYCVRGDQDNIPKPISFIIYEPVESIGTGQNASIQDILAMREKINITPQQKFIYGGSVTAENAKEYLTNPYIDGVLPGGASLDPEQFYAIIRSSL